ncbi:hypothetical protein H2248_004090 [Termitomyces sp. 'cryptogamus']|nr:hypothetical protein H2248_007041 [Termitomyces sp. 'cryptogamus']KAH0578124.1 hypothetical protein H2248_004090 [Termitomyces sp. 'cryptogamus']
MMCTLSCYSFWCASSLRGHGIHLITSPTTDCHVPSCQLLDHVTEMHGSTYVFIRSFCVNIVSFSCVKMDMAMALKRVQMNFLQLLSHWHNAIKFPLLLQRSHEY